MVLLVGMSTPDELRDAANARISRRVPTSANAAQPRTRTLAAAGYTLGDTYSTLSVKIPADLATAIADAATQAGQPMSSIARDWLAAGARRNGYTLTNTGEQHDPRP